MQNMKSAGERLADSFLELLATQPFEKITVSRITEYTGQNNFRRSVAPPLTDMYLRIISEAFGDSITDDIRNAVTFFTGGMITFAEAALEASDIPRPEVTSSVFVSCVPPVLAKYLDPPASA